MSAADVLVGYDSFGRPVAEVVTACKGKKDAPLHKIVDEHFEAE